MSPPSGDLSNHSRSFENNIENNIENNNEPVNKTVPTSKADIRYVNTFLAIYDLESVKNNSYKNNSYNHRGPQFSERRLDDSDSRNDVDNEQSSSADTSAVDNDNEEEIIVDIEGDSAIAVQQ